MLLVRVVMLALLVSSAAVVLATLGKTPAFNPRLVSETIVGEGRTALGSAMYDKGTYDFQRGFGFLMADAIISAQSGPRDRAAAAEVALARAAQARDALEAAVSRDPGNARAWASLAWARARLGDRPGSIEAWRASSAIAPNSMALAGARLDLIGLLSERESGRQLLTEADFAAIARDIAVLAHFDQPALTLYMTANPHLSRLASGTGAE